MTSPPFLDQGREAQKNDRWRSLDSRHRSGTGGTSASERLRVT